MPRASGSGKRQSGGGHRDSSKHDNGAVTSAKRGSRKSHSANGSSSAKPLENGAALPTPTSSLHNGHANGHATAPADAAAKSPFDAAMSTRLPDDKTALDAARRASLGEESEASSDHFHNAATHVLNGHANGVPVNGSLRQIDVNYPKNSDVHRDSGILDMASTVLRALPMQDTLAILIILMHVPTISLLVIYGIFACITFVPPVRTTSGMPLNLAEMFDANSTTPSLFVVACLDFVFLLIWLFLWAPIQDAVLDLAKPVIAITLGGATRNDPSFRGIRTGFTWVFLYHIIRGTQSQWGHLVPNMPAAWKKVLSEETPIGYYSKLYDNSSPYAWVRSVLAIHILTQSLIRFIREWYLRREKGGSNPSDPELARQHSAHIALPDAANDASATPNDTDTAISTPALPQPPPTPQLSTAKKRRKQSAQVRLKQPLWAALASTKIVVVKEYELSHAPSESARANATDIHNLGNATFYREPRQIWITYIGSDEVCFSTSYFAHAEFDPSSPCSELTSNLPSRPPGIDMTKPFYVRVNSALWQPTRMHALKELDDEPSEASCWTGDIYGLRPASKYVCEFVDSRTDKVLLTANIRTIKEVLQSRDGSSPMVSDGPQSLRPDSPVTTLKTSIDAAQERLTHERNHLKNLRKDCKIRINALKKENEATDNQLATAGSSDERYRQKIRQQETQRTQAERETEQLADTVRRYDSSPELAEHKRKVERTFAAEKKAFEAAQREFLKHRSELESEFAAKGIERSNLNARRNKIATRIAKVDNELVNLSDANSRGINEAERRKKQHDMQVGKILAMRQQYLDRIDDIKGDNGERLETILNLRGQLESLAPAMATANGGMMEGVDPGMVPFPPPQTTPWNSSAVPASLGGSLGGGHWPASSADMQPSLSGPALAPSAMMWPGSLTTTVYGKTRARMRSSSMLSDVSGFTGSSDGSLQNSPYFHYQQPIGNSVRGHRGMGANRSNGSSGSGGDGNSM
ncbi:ubiquitination network signaling [Cordyceps militaris]|uniref:Ubiquitination network signaling n=1 Tax=Cordyceps militaris TaxID=73501 RepID=A0A2H4SGG1_CORMI|nr:ubiquitination network signaling [Cordyceps militaris]